MFARWLAMSMLCVGLFAPAVYHAGTAAAVPCYDAGCVPNVAQNVISGAPCAPSGAFSYGLDAGGATYVCTVAGAWTPTGPLIGVYNVALPCKQDQIGASAQETTGAAVQCMPRNSAASQWVHRSDTPAPPRCVAVISGCPFRQ